MTDHVANEALRRIAHIADTVRKPDDPQRMGGYSLRRALNTLAHDARRSEHEFDISKDLERVHQSQHGGLIVPWEAFATRADIVGTNTAGGYLVQTLNVEAADALRPNMLLGGLGATYISAPMGANVNLPRQSTAATAAWLSTETTSATESDQVFWQVSFMPYTVASYTELSRLLILQAGPSPAESVVRRDLIAIIGRAMDKAALQGSGLNQPKGLNSYTGVNAFSGTTLNIAGITNAAVALGDGLDESAGIACDRTTAGTLAQRQVLNGSDRVWQGSLIAGSCVGYPARSSSALASGTLYLGSWKYLNVVTWGEGIEVTVHPFGDTTNSNFQKGIVGVRAFLTCDIQPKESLIYPS